MMIVVIASVLSGGSFPLGDDDFSWRVNQILLLLLLLLLLLVAFKLTSFERWLWQFLDRF